MKLRSQLFGHSYSAQISTPDLGKAQGHPLLQQGADGVFPAEKGPGQRQPYRIALFPQAQQLGCGGVQGQPDKLTGFCFRAHLIRAGEKGPHGRFPFGQVGRFFQRGHGEGRRRFPGTLGEEVFQRLTAETVQQGNGHGQPFSQRTAGGFAEKGRAAGFLQLCQTPFPVQRTVDGGFRYHIADSVGAVALFILDGEGNRFPGLNGQEQGNGNPAALFPVQAVKPCKNRRGGPGHVLFGAGAEHFHPQPSVGVTAGKAGAGKHRFQIGEKHGVRGKAVGGLTAGSGCGGHVFRALHPSLNFGGTDAGAAQLFHAGNHGQIPQAQVVAGAAGCRKGQAAGLGAHAPVAASSAQHGAEIALSGNGHT